MAPPTRRSSSPTELLDCFAIAAPGLEPLVGAELAALGVTGTIEPGGVGWSGTMASLMRANLWLRTASRVVVRIARFRAHAFYELERHARQVPWERFVRPGGPVDFRVTSRKSRLYHTEGIAERLARGIEQRLGAPGRWSAADRAEDGERVVADDDRPASEEETSGGQLFVVRVVRDVCTISADSSGELLHRRGYRQALSKAPIRETLAAAVLLAADWRGDVALVDPMCGSGTIAIEGALIARRVAPGLRRDFAFNEWPDAYEPAWAAERESAAAMALPASPVPIIASDRDAGAIAAARANAERAGVGADIETMVRPLSALEAPPGGGLVAVNPPYGVRVGELLPLRDLYAALGRVVRERCVGWRLAILSPDPRLDRQIGLELTERLRTSNGGIPVRLMVGDVPPGR